MRGFVGCWPDGEEMLRTTVPAAGAGVEEGFVGW
jgi:hypothetical protein